MLSESLCGPNWPKADADTDNGKARLDDVPNELTAPFWFGFT